MANSIRKKSLLINNKAVSKVNNNFINSINGIDIQPSRVSIDFNNSLFLSNGSNTLYVSPYSEDFTFNWKRITLPFTINNICGYANGVLVGEYSSSSKYYYSKDNGVTWTQATLPFYTGRSFLLVGNDKFVMLGDYRSKKYNNDYHYFWDVYVSTDFENWTKTLSDIGCSSSVFFGYGEYNFMNNYFRLRHIPVTSYGTSGNPVRLYSTDGITWTPFTKSYSWTKNWKTYYYTGLLPDGVYHDGYWGLGGDKGIVYNESVDGDIKSMTLDFRRIEYSYRIFDHYVIGLDMASGDSKWIESIGAHMYPCNGIKLYDLYTKQYTRIVNFPTTGMVWRSFGDNISRFNVIYHNKKYCIFYTRNYLGNINTASTVQSWEDLTYVYKFYKINLTTLQVEEIQDSTLRELYSAVYSPSTSMTYKGKYNNNSSSMKIQNF